MTIPGLPWKNFQDLFVAHECSDLMYWHHKIKSRGLQVICERNEQKKMISIRAYEEVHDFQRYFQDFPGP